MRRRKQPGGCRQSLEGRGAPTAGVRDGSSKACRCSWGPPATQLLKLGSLPDLASYLPSCPCRSCLPSRSHVWPLFTLSGLSLGQAVSTSCIDRRYQNTVPGAPHHLLPPRSFRCPLSLAAALLHPVRWGNLSLVEMMRFQLLCLRLPVVSVWPTPVARSWVRVSGKLLFLPTPLSGGVSYAFLRALCTPRGNGHCIGTFWTWHILFLFYVHVRVLTA